MNRNRIVSLVLCLVLSLSLCTSGLVAQASFSDFVEYNNKSLSGYLTEWTPIDALSALFASNHSQKYYTTPTETVQDANGNVTNYYRSGPTTNTKIIDSYNHTLNNIWNNTSTTNNYSANVKLNDFLNTYATYNNNYTYNTRYNSWYYDNSRFSYSYTDNDTYYCTDNSKYYVSIDNSTDEYYMIDVQYSPTYVTVNYNYYNSDNTTKFGNVTNVYYYELTDGRNSSSLSVSDVAGIDLGLDVVNYSLVPDSPDILSLQHFDGDYSDSSFNSRSPYIVARSTTYVDSGAFGQAVRLSSGSCAGITIPNLSSYDGLSFDFRVYYDDISNLGVYLGDVNLMQEVVTDRTWNIHAVYSDDGKKDDKILHLASDPVLYNKGQIVDYSSFVDIHRSFYSSLGKTPSLVVSDTFKEEVSYPSAYSDSGFVDEESYSPKYGYMSPSSFPTSSTESTVCTATITDRGPQSLSLNGSVIDCYHYYFTVSHYKDSVYTWHADDYVCADFPFDNFKNQWVYFRIVVKDGALYYFINGDLVGNGSFSIPVADKFYIKSNGSVYLDELCVSTGNRVNVSSYNPSSAPFDTNMVLALPDNLQKDTIYVRSSVTVDKYRIGGVRPSSPSAGFFYIPLHTDYTGSQPQIFDGSDWLDVEAYVSDGEKVVSAVGYEFIPLDKLQDIKDDSSVNPDNPGGVDSPGDSEDKGFFDRLGDFFSSFGHIFDSIGGFISKLFSFVSSSVDSFFDSLNPDNSTSELWLYDVPYEFVAPYEDGGSS